MAIRISPKELAPELQRRFRGIRTLAKKAIRVGAARGRGILAHKTPVDLGQMKSAWRVNRLTMEIINDAPHAGIIEGGARPHKVNAAGRRALVRWAMRQLGVDEKTANAVAAGTIKKLEREGQKGKFIVRDSMGKLRREVAKEMERQLRLNAGRRAR